MTKIVRIPSLTVLLATGLGICAGCSQPGAPAGGQPADTEPPAQERLEQTVEPASPTPDSSGSSFDTNDSTATADPAADGTTRDITGTAVGLSSLVTANNKFGLELYRNLKELPGNVFFSPHSIATAFTMSYGGASAETASQMAHTLHLPAGNVHSAVADLDKILQPSSDSYELRIANRLWIQDGLSLLESYRQLTREFYGADVTLLDFVGATEDARQSINLWVSNETNKKIPELIARNAITTATRLVLTNAVYFKGTWLSQFDESVTRPASFYGTNETSVPMMYQRADFPYMETESFQAVRLPYQGDKLSMLIILPRDRSGLGALEHGLDAGGIEELADSMHPVDMEIWLPRFSASSQFKLNEVLQDLGMNDAFSPSLADFSGITGQKGLYITEAIHKAFVEVNEEGSEAAAATAVVMGIESESRAVAFRADHPFVFMIRDDRTGALLFFGRFVDPES